MSDKNCLTLHLETENSLSKEKKLKGEVRYIFLIILIILIILYIIFLVKKKFKK